MSDRCWYLWGPGDKDAPFPRRYAYCWQIPSPDDTRHHPEGLDPWFGRYAHQFQGRASE